MTAQWSPSALDGVHLSRVANDTRLWVGHSVHYGLSVVQNGAFDFWYRGKPWQLSPGRVKLKEPGELHRDLKVHRALTAQTLAIDPRVVRDVADGLGVGRPIHFSTAVAEHATATQRLVTRLHAAINDPTSERLTCESLLAESLIAAIEGYSERVPPSASCRGDPALRRARDYLEQHLSEQVSLEALAGQAGMNRFVLLRGFRAQFGLPPHAYLTHLRVARARERLSRGEPVAEVALAVGYCDQSQLTRHFTRIVGLAPRRFAVAVRGTRRSRTPKNAVD